MTKTIDINIHCFRTFKEDLLHLMFKIFQIYYYIIFILFNLFGVQFYNEKFGYASNK